MLTIYTSGSFIRSNLQRNVFDNAFINILRIPLHINYTFDHIGKWHLYAIGGASINILALNHFNISTSPVGEDNPISTRDGQDVRKGTSIYDGVLEGGNFKNNSYLTANVGMGIERYLTSRWSLFVQPIYQRLIFKKGFGPNDDHFNTLSIQIGAKSTFR